METALYRFTGFSAPNYTQVPDVFFDEMMTNLSDTEMRVLLYIFRRTFGFKKVSDTISLKQLTTGIRTREGRVFDRGAGVSKSSACRAVNGLTAKGIIAVTHNASAARGDEATTYTLVFASPVSHGGTPPLSHDETPVFHQETPPVSHGGTPPVPPQNTPRVPRWDTQETVEQETVRQEEILSKGTPIDQFGDNFGDNSGDNHLSPRTLPVIIASDGPHGSGIVDNFPLPLTLPLPPALLGPDSVDTSPLPPGTVATGDPPDRDRVDTSPPTAAPRKSRSPVRRVAPAPAAPPPDSPDPRPVERIPQIAAIISDFSKEMNDYDHTTSNITQATRLYAHTGRSLDVFLTTLYAARTKTRKATGITNRMAYFFEVLRQEVDHLREGTTRASPRGTPRTAANPVAAAAPWNGRPPPSVPHDTTIRYPHGRNADR